jgi:hypothetical protein
MKIFVQIVILFLLAFSSIPLYSQFDTEPVNDTLDNMILYNKQKTYGVVLHSLGMGLNFRTGKRLSYFKTRMLEFEFVTMRSYKQFKLINPYVINSKRYVFGKSNDAFFIRAGFVWKKLLNKKPYWGGVEVRFTYGGGLSLGLAKPYYLYIIKDINGSGETFTIVPEKFDPDKHSRTDIYGRAPFTKGINEITVHPGLHLKAGLNFEWGKNNTKIISGEVGAAADILPAGMTVMYENQDQIIFPTAYITISLGKRYNKY